MIRFAAAGLILLSAGTASAQSGMSGDSLAIGINGGTTGGGIQVEASFGPIFVLRGGAESLGYDFDASHDDVDYSGRFDFDTVSGFIDLHPLANAFTLSGGVYVGPRSIGLEATPTAPVTVGGQTFTPSQVGTLSGEIKLKTVAPYLGLGFDNTFSGAGRWGFRATAGVAWSEKPEVTLDSSGGSLSNDPVFRERLAQEAESIQADAENYGLFPVVQVGLNYRF